MASGDDHVDDPTPGTGEYAELEEKSVAAQDPEEAKLASPTQEAAAAVTLAPDILAESLSEYLGAWWRRIRGGESGALPILAGLVLIVVIFEVQQPKFLSALNIVNLLVQATFFILLGAAEIFALLLSEIDLSVGYVAAVGGAIIAALISPPNNWPWWAGVIVGLLASAALGALQGILITRLHLPSFVVTLAGLLGFSGVLIFVFDADKGAVGGVISINNDVVYNLVNGNMSQVASWIALVVLVGLYALVTIGRAARRRKRGLSAPPLSIAILTVALVAVAGVVLVIICNVNRGNLAPLRGVPWVIPFVLVIIAGWSFFLAKTRSGRYIYAIGASPEAARRAGISVAWIRTLAFTLSGLTAGLAGLVYESRLASISVGFDGGTYVLYAVAAAVIGGTSLFGGRGKAFHAVLGGIVIAAVYNGLGLLGEGTAGTDMATALVLLGAVTIDSLVRRRGSTT
jgi:D-xylose transport system permease protein